MYSGTHTCVHLYTYVFPCKCQSAAKRRQHRHIALSPPPTDALPLSLSLALHQPLWRICGECSGFCLCRNCSGRCCCCCYFIFGSGTLRAFVEQQDEWGMRSVRKGAFYLQRQTDWETRDERRGKRADNGAQQTLKTHHQLPVVHSKVRCFTAARCPLAAITYYALSIHSPLTHHLHALRLCAFSSRCCRRQLLFYFANCLAKQLHILQHLKYGACKHTYTIHWNGYMCMSVCVCMCI